MLLEVKDLCVAYGDIEAVHGISFEIENGELVSIIGTNGAGKTTTLRAIMGLQPVRSGSVIFDGGDITGLPAHKRAQMGIRLVPERARCFPQLSVYENLMMGVYGNSSALKGQLDSIYSLFPILRERSRQSANTLSGGESQRVKLATELSKRDTGKTLYILDEPTTGLHFEDIRILMDVLQKLVDRGNTVIIIEHNLDVIKLADWLIDMGPEGGRGGGQLLFAGTPEEMAKSKIGYTYKFLAPLLKKK